MEGAVALPKAEANEMGSFTDELDQVRLKNNSERRSTLDSNLAWKNEELSHGAGLILSVRCRLRSWSNNNDYDENPNVIAGIVDTAGIDIGGSMTSKWTTNDTTN
jgi:hypothetical protein